MALLEVGEIDYIFIYRSVARQHGLKWVALPDEINLKNPEMAEIYRKVSVEISGQTPGSLITKAGAPMVYGVTIPKSARNPKAALAFVAFLLERDKVKAKLDALIKALEALRSDLYKVQGTADADDKLADLIEKAKED